MRVREPTLTLREHIERLLVEMDLRHQQRFDAQQQALTAALLSAEKAVQTAMAASEKAVAKAENATERRFESVNEFRKTLADQTASFLTRLEYDSAHTALVDKISDLATRMERSEGRGSGLDIGWKVLLGAATLALGIWLAFHR
jgi:hypothetical protein